MVITVGPADWEAMTADGGPDPAPGLHARVRAVLRETDGSLASSVSILTGLSRTQLDELGGVDEERNA